MIVLRIPAREWYEDARDAVSRHWASFAVMFCAFGQASDVVSSVFQAPGSYETNPFCRHADGTFWLYRGIALKLFFLIEFTALALSLYFSIERLDKFAARLAFVAPYVIFGLFAFEAAANNLLLHFGWYTPLAGW